MLGGVEVGVAVGECEGVGEGEFVVAFGDGAGLVVVGCAVASYAGTITYFEFAHVAHGFLCFCRRERSTRATASSATGSRYWVILRLSLMRCLRSASMWCEQAWRVRHIPDGVRHLLQHGSLITGLPADEQ